MFRNAIGVISCWLLLNGSAMAEQSDVMLEVTGLIAGGPVMLDRDAVQGLPATTVQTSTVVTDGVHSFTGFLMRDLLEQVQATGDTITAIALNDYEIDIPIADFHDYDVIVAYEMDGKALTRDDKGPLWIIYPRDAHRALQDIRYDYRWVWQLSRIDVK